MGPNTPQQASREPGEPGDHELAWLVRLLPDARPQKDAGCEMLAARHRSIVGSCIRRCRHDPEPADDLMRAGCVGMLKAISNFDPAVGDTLAAYARVSVSAEIRRSFRDTRGQIRVRRSARELP
jgi:DNA-directed RNA polymerase specialized sigma subunit